MKRLAWRTICVAAWAVLAAVSALAAETGELPERVVYAFPENFATGEFLLFVRDRARTGPHEIWSYAPETDTLRHVMTAPGGFPVSLSRVDCCVVWDHEAKRLHVGGTGRETVTHRVGGWAPDVEVAGKDLEYHIFGLVGDPPRLLVGYRRTFWTYFSLFGDSGQRTETTRRWLELRDPWTYAKIATMDGLSEPDFDQINGVRNVDHATCLTYCGGGARFLSLEPLRFEGVDIGFVPAYLGGYHPTFRDDGQTVVQRLQIDAAARTVTVEETEVGQWPLHIRLGALRDGLYLVKSDQKAQTIEVHSTPGREPVVATTIEPGRDAFHVHGTGQYVITYDGNNSPACDTADVWALTSDGTLVKTRTLEFPAPEQMPTKK